MNEGHLIYSEHQGESRMNTDGDELNVDAFAFLDITRPYVAWAVYRGILVTPQQVPLPGGQFVSWWWANLLRDGRASTRNGSWILRTCGNNNFRTESLAWSGCIVSWTRLAPPKPLGGVPISGWTTLLNLASKSRPRVILYWMRTGLPTVPAGPMIEIASGCRDTGVRNPTPKRSRSGKHSLKAK